MAKSKLEYIWLDGSQPTQGLRSKTKVISDFSGKLEDCPEWSFDGSSTQQAEGGNSDCLLKPVYICPDPVRLNGFLVLTEVLNADGTPHESNGRATISDDDGDFWFGFEQEYFLWDPETDKPVGFPKNGYPAPQGPYYCGVGGNSVFGRDFKDEHLDICIEAGLNIEGTNGEVAAGQWEWQVFAKGGKQAGDEVWIGRYLMERLSEQYGLFIEYHPKPLGDTDWNGSGMHANFSNSYIRNAASQEKIERVCEGFRGVVKEHIAVYGAHNEQRLTGKHETAALEGFSYGVSDRGASIRIPIYTVNNGWSGYLEDRRPSSNADPYKVAARIVKTVSAVTVPATAHAHA